MPVTIVEVRRVYYDSVILMKLQAALEKLPGVQKAGAMMALDTNKDILRENGLLTAEAEAALPEDLIISIQGRDEPSAKDALAGIDDLLSNRRRQDDQEYLPKTLATAAKMLPEASFVLVSVPGQYAATVARDAIHSNKHVFLYSDNVPVESEVSLKKAAAEKGVRDGAGLRHSYH